MYHASILAIGTELTQGQITNRNAAWISERLTDLGIEVVGHLTVPDDRVLIRGALETASAQAELLIVTGGLGPTSDDFTREIIAEWLGSPLEFRAGTWEKITRRLTERGIEVAQSNRSQCYFPREAIVLENLEGTADGFRFRYTNKKESAIEVLVLPGPPREGQHLWDRFVKNWLSESFSVSTPTELESWFCLGKSESSLGEIVEATVAGFGVKTGYRASVPYVEVKIWIPDELAPDGRISLLAKLETALAPYSVARSAQEVPEKFLAAIKNVTERHHLTLIDLGSAGRLGERLIGILRSESGHELRDRIEILTRLPSADSPQADASGLPESASEWIFALYPDGSVAVVGPPGKRVRPLPNPYPSPAMAERLGGYRAEMAMKIWSEMLMSFSESPGVSS